MPRQIGAHILSVDPRRCRLSALREQDAGRLTLQGCVAQLRSIEAYGQFVPALAWPVVDDPNHHLEHSPGRFRVVESSTHCDIPYGITHTVCERVGLSGRLTVGFVPNLAGMIEKPQN